VTIPFNSMHNGQGQLTVEVLDPEDQVIGHSEQQAAASEAKGWWQSDVKLNKAVSIEDLAWHRLRYRFAYTDHNDIAAAQGTESISQILRMPVIHILGQQSYLTGGQAAVRVIVTDSKNEPIPGNSSVQIEVDSRVIFTGPLNQRGTAEAQFRFP